jgi:hypothetical protein
MPEADSVTSFSAADSMLGYFYQVRVALFVALKQLRNDEQFFVGLETVDDIAIAGESGSPVEILQIKHHRSRTGDLSDLSSDLWKTLRVWSEGIHQGTIGNNCLCILMTTGSAPNGSAASLLKNIGRNPVQAWQLLCLAMQRSTSTALEPAFTAFRALGESRQKALLASIFIQDASPDISKINELIRQEIYHAVRPEQLSPFLERLEGWWYRRAVMCLSTNPPSTMNSMEIQGQIAHIRDQFGPDSLPIDEDLLTATMTAGPPYTDMVFVKQLETIPAPRHIVNAIRDYYRAFTQRSRWMKHQLILPQDLAIYETQLKEAWERRFIQMCDVLGDEPGEEAIRKEALLILAWCEDHSHVPIRRNCTERFVAVGTYHMLADGLHVGWHPQFKERLTHLLQSPQPGAAL